MERERFGSRLGFILVSAGCAIGLGNVWRFPYITGEYGGAAFVVLYLIFLVIFALPVLVMEFAAGRASQRSIARSYDELEPEGGKWHRFKWVGLAGNYLLMMFYTVVAGWMLAFMVKSAMGEFNGASTEHVASVFGQLLADPVQMTIYMLIIVAIGVITTRAGLKNGVERVTKVMMVALFVVLVALCVRAVTLPGAEEGLEFYLMPDFGKLFAGNTPAEQWATFGDAVYAALGQAFFTVSVGMGSMAIFGSYIGKDRRLTGEAVRVGVLDTLVALMAGLVIFPSCFAFGVEPASGPSLVFITLPIVFNAMPLGQLWGTLFFLFMSFAALSTVIAVFETIMAFSMDQWGVRREKACLVNGALIALLSIPCVLGFNVLSGVAIPGIGDIQSIED
ncbi:sodium-dependent transporter, partial [Ellagibacter isourolithinifaciens]